MTNIPYAELTAAVRGEGEAIVAAARMGLDVAVPTCGDWQMPDLLRHVAAVYHRAATAVDQRATQPVEWQAPGDDGADPIAVLADALDELVHALSGADADTAVWNWSGRDQNASFWARRMAHESAVHRFDAQRAHGMAQPIDADLAHDGLDELVDVIAPRVVERDQVELTEATYSFVATDEGVWHVQFGPDGLQRLDVAKEPDVTARGTASALLLAAYARVPWTSLEVDGDMAALDAWNASLRF